MRKNQAKDKTFWVRNIKRKILEQPRQSFTRLIRLHFNTNDDYDLR